MQLKRQKAGALRAALGLLTANLLVATAHAQAPETVPISHSSTTDSDEDYESGSDLNSGRTRIDSAVLFYQEAGGRVRAIEPVISATLNGSGGEVLNLRVTSDTLTGATPNGATPSRLTQTFVTPASTGASGRNASSNSESGSTIRQYKVAPHVLPVDDSFQDQRWAADIAYSAPWGEQARVSVGGGFSTEHDYTSYVGNVGLSHDFNQHNTTLAAGLNLEYDQSKPFGGTPTPFTSMSGTAKGGDKTKSVVGAVFGVTQVINRGWLAQLNYSIGQTNGYQNDPYRIISVINPTTGDPSRYLYEGRPDRRLRQSIYLDNKIALGPTTTDFSARAYHDSWGIDSITLEASERLQLGQQFFIEPGLRYYSQTAADFFHDYLLSSQALPTFASSDSRLDRFHAMTESIKLGFKSSPTTEWYVALQDYRQSGSSHRAGAPGALATENLFGGAKATSVLFGVSFAFW